MGGSTLATSFEFCLCGTCRVFHFRTEKVRLLTNEKLLEMLSKWILTLLFHFWYIPLTRELRIAWNYEKVNLSFLFSEEKVSLSGICNSVSTWSWQKLAFVIGEKVFKNRVFEVLIHICVQNSKMQKTGSVFLKCKAQKHRLIRIVSSAFVVIRACLFQFSSLMIE